MNISTLVETIEAKRNEEIRMHPYGFLQLSLGDFAKSNFLAKNYAISNPLRELCHENMNDAKFSLSEGAWRDSGYRLHVWSDELPSMKRPEFQVHDHIYGVRSQILLGALRDIQYIIEENAQGEYPLFKATPGKLLNTKQKVSCTKRSVSYLSAGDKYFVPKGDFHSSESLAPLTATLFQKLDADLSRSPDVVGSSYYEKTEL